MVGFKASFNSGTARYLTKMGGGWGGRGGGGGGSKESTAPSRGS